ncbi:PIN2/TERF1-interacting telomerase inhibitor 1-like isoform X1 [Watersipora subatra]|uniref:PIN2/TERF1-interacting telomerase inhibitor 1-like isoform X1 n=2 Tax=Watersipora subatra TaxID=2589382 RepID=UPI00355B1225
MNHQNLKDEKLKYFLFKNGYEASSLMSLEVLESQSLQEIRMSMLAQGRRKQKISTNPNGLNFGNDDSNIGQRLMKEMGWEKGRGLGLNEQGDKNPIKVKANRESRGLGCTKSDVDKWVAHQDEFNSLLANLNKNSDEESDTVAAGDSKEEKSENKLQVQSLEAKSKSSRSRVHYMKFTKGKDLSKHSDKDLACILGPSRSGNCTPANQSKDPSAANSENDSNPDSADPFLSDAQHVTSTLSLHEYFQSKMAAKKNSSSNLLAEMAVSTDPDSGNDVAEGAEEMGAPSFFIGDSKLQVKAESFSKKKKKKSKNIRAVEDVAEVPKKKKKKKRKEDRELEDRHARGGKTKPKPPDETMKFVSESSEDESSGKDIENRLLMTKDKKEVTAKVARKHSLNKCESDSHLDAATDADTESYRPKEKKCKKRHKDSS